MRRSPFLACALLLMVSCTPFAGTVAADSSILLDLDQDLVILTPGQATNVTLSVENNASSIYDFTIELGDSSAGLEWVVNLTATSMPQVYPYSTDTLDIVVSLGAGGTNSAALRASLCGGVATACLLIRYALPSYWLRPLHADLRAAHLVQISATPPWVRWLCSSPQTSFLWITTF